MSTILLADDSPHAQRMGERILREEGFDVASVADESTALARLADADPDLVIVDVFLPGRRRSVEAWIFAGTSRSSTATCG